MRLPLGANSYWPAMVNILSTWSATGAMYLIGLAMLVEAATGAMPTIRLITLFISGCLDKDMTS